LIGQLLVNQLYLVMNQLQPQMSNYCHIYIYIYIVASSV
jgi:hypothetical protein